MCLETYKTYNPEWNIIVLDDIHLYNYIEADVAKQIISSKLRVSHRSDLIRIYILAKFGGVWADLTTVCTRPLDWIQKYVQSQMILYTYESTANISSWFIACPQSSILASKLQNALLKYIHQHKWEYIDEYFIFHKIFSTLILTDEVFKSVYRFSPKLSSQNAHTFQQDNALNKPLTTNNRAKVDAPFTSAIYKLYGRSHSKIDISAGTYANYLFVKLLGQNEHLGGLCKTDCDTSEKQNKA